MGQVEIAGRDVDTDVRLWTPDLRREASLVIGGLAAVFLLAGLIWYALAPGSAGTFLWVAIVLLVLLLLAEAAVLVTGIAREENVGPHWLSEPEAHRQTREPQAATPGAQARAGTPADEEVPAPPEIDLQCPECGEMFAVEDTGERPLATECPGCGRSGKLS